MTSPSHQQAAAEGEKGLPGGLSTPAAPSSASPSKVSTVSWVGSTVGGTLNMAVPQFAGAIDILVVAQPDGTLKCSPFYVRFGKYQVHLHQRRKDVAIVVNGRTAGFGMSLSRNGEAFFVASKGDQTPGAGDGSAPGSPAAAAAAGGGSSSPGSASPGSGMFRVSSEKEMLGAITQWYSATSLASMGGGASPSASQQDLAALLDDNKPSPPSPPTSKKPPLPYNEGVRPRSRRPGKLGLVRLAFGIGSSGNRQPLPELPPALAGQISKRSAPWEDEVEDEDGSSDEDDNDKGEEELFLDAVGGLEDAGDPLEVEVSLCGREVLERQLGDPAELAEAFERHRVAMEDYWGPGGAAAVGDDEGALMVRVNGQILPWKEVAAFHEAVAAADADAADAEGPVPGTSPPGIWQTLWPFAGRGNGVAAKLDAKRQAAPPAPDSPGRSDTAAAGERSLVPTSEQLLSLDLHPGKNSVEFVLNQHIFGDYRLRAFVYLMPWNSRLVVSDVDGTITRSDVLGHLLPAVGMDWSHAGVVSLLSDIYTNGYMVMYLSSRAISQAQLTRDFLQSLKQAGKQLPHGPIVISPDGLFPSLYREVVVKRPHEFKIATLSAIRSLFPDDWNPFYAGFGNRGTDEVSYQAVGISPGRIFTINPKGEIKRVALAGRGMEGSFGTLEGINKLVNEVFPPLSQPSATEALARHEFGDVSFWKPSFGLDLIDSDEEEHAEAQAATSPKPLQPAPRAPWLQPDAKAAREEEEEDIQEGRRRSSFQATSLYGTEGG